MRRGWKRFAERAANPAFDDGERGEALFGALRGDWRAEVPDGLITLLRTALDDHQGELFSRSVTDRVEALREEAAGYPLAGALLDCAARAVSRGHRGEGALVQAAADALSERVASGHRQVEEHFLRESSTRNAGCVTNGIDSAIEATDLKVLARQCVGGVDERVSRVPLRRTGIDDGVPLP